MRKLLAFTFAALALLAFDTPAQRRTPAQPADTAQIKLFRMKSPLLSEFWGRDMFLEAGVVLPPDYSPEQKLPICFNIHGFGGSHRGAWRRGQRLVQSMERGDYPRMLYVYLNAQCPRGHHEFADSANNGPCGRALTQEFIPALEKKFGAAGTPEARFLTGHSSGGWSSFWLQITYPKFFGGTWSTAPDSVDFRDFTGIDIYRYENAFVDPSGATIQLMRRGNEWVRSIREFVEREYERRSFGGQFSSFDYVFSPRGPDGRPMPLFDKKSGKIDREVAKAWEKYDIGLVLKRNWTRLGPLLRGKLRIYMGTLDTFRLEGATKLLKEDLEELGSDAEILLVEGRDHGSLVRPHDEHWPKGMMEHIHRQMWQRWSSR